MNDEDIKSPGNAILEEGLKGMVWIEIGEKLVYIKTDVTFIK